MRGWHFKEIPNEDMVRGAHLKKKSRLKILPLTRVRGFFLSKKCLLEIEKTRQGRRPKNSQSKFYVSKKDQEE